MSFAQQPSLLISEYVEGSSNNKALEFYNPTNQTINLSEGAYQVKFYFNGSSSAGKTINLNGVVAPGDVFVLAHSSASGEILADQSAGGSWFNGNDAVALLKESEFIDSIGRIGENPGSGGWGTPLVNTTNATLRRKGPIKIGDSNPYDAFNPASQWLGFPQNTFDDLGQHDVTPPQLLSTIPISGAIDVPIDSVIIAAFNEPVTVIDFTVRYNNFEFEVFGDYALDGDSLVFTPDNHLPYSETFNANLFKIKDANGNPFEGDLVFGGTDNFTWIFTSQDEPLPVPDVHFETDSVSVPEDAGVAELTVLLSFVTPNTVTVNYETIPQSASGDDFEVASGTLTFLPGSTAESISIPIIDDNLDEPDETFAVALSEAQHAILVEPQTAIVTILDDDSPPVVDFTHPNYNVNESAGEATISLSLSAPSGKQISANYTTVNNGTAIPDEDYIPTSGILNFAPGETEASFNVTILNDAVAEDDKTLGLEIPTAVNATIGTTNNPATLNIIDDDSLPVVDFSQANYSISETGGFAVITASLSFAYPQTVTVNYATGNGGTAIPGTDYTPVNGILSFSPGQTEQSFSVPIINNGDDTPDKTVELLLNNAFNAILGTTNNPAILTILDDDSLPVVDFSQANYSVSETGGFAVITASLSFAYPQTVTVQYATGNGGTAIPGTDYTPVNGILSFSPGQTEQSFSVPIINNEDDTPDKTVELLLNNAFNAILGTTNNPATLTIIDDDLPPVVTILINELDATQTDPNLLVQKSPQIIPEPEGDTAEFVELFDGGHGNTALNGYILVFYNGLTNNSYYTIDLNGYSTNGNGYFVAGNAGTPNVDIVFADDLLRNGEDAVALYEDSTANFPNGTQVTTNNLIDAIVYQTASAPASNLNVLLNPGQPIVNEAGGGNAASSSSQRCPNGSGGLRNTDTYSQFSPTPGTINSCTNLVQPLSGSNSLNTYLPLVLR